MRNNAHKRFNAGLGLVLGLGLLFILSLGAQAAEPLVWRAGQNRVDAQIKSWTLQHLLEKIAAVTGWQIYLEPDTEHTVSAKFQNLPVVESLSRLLGDLNFALLPQTNAAPKLFVFRTSVQEATQLVMPPQKMPAEAKPADLIPNELIVTLKPGAKLSIDDLARRLGAKIVGRAEKLNAYRLQFEDEGAANAARDLLEAERDVAAVEANFSIAPPTRTEALSFSSPLPLNLKAKPGADPNRLVIGLIDTPVQAQEPRIKDFLLSGISVVGETVPSTKFLSHGTSMAETILRGIALAPQPAEGSSTRILPVDVYGSNENTTTFDVANGIYAAVENGATLINLSLGGDGESPMLRRIIQEAKQQGVLLVAAAGNEPSTIPTYPAAYPEVLAATAGDKKGNVAPYANHGSFVDVVAPGASIVYFNNQAYLVSGTSASTAYVSGVAAGLASSTRKSLAEIETELRNTLAVKSPAKP
jgi:hypothetical protein